jgi:hypothetical protein
MRMVGGDVVQMWAVGDGIRNGGPDFDSVERGLAWCGDNRDTQHDRWRLYVGTLENVDAKYLRPMVTIALRKPRPIRTARTMEEVGPLIMSGGWQKVCTAAMPYLRML